MTINNVPLLDLQAQYEPIKEEIKKVIDDVFDTKRFIMGPKIEELETKVAAYCGTKEAIGVSSGTDALIVSLMALEIGYGDEVITTPFTFFATAGSIARVGAKPVFVDIDPKTFNIDPDLIEAKITPKTKAIMPVHLFGQMSDMDKIMAIAKKHDLYVIEDACQAIGAEYKAADGVVKKAGSVGDVGCFSFFPSKNLGCIGDGGIVTTNNVELAAKIKSLRNHGESKRYFHDMVGGNFRLDALQAAALLVKLPLLEKQHEGRIKNGEFYNKNIGDVVAVPYVKEGYRTIYNQYTLRVSDRELFQKKLNDKNVGNAVYYPVPLHLQQCFQDLGYKEGDMPQAEQAAKEVVSIPVYAELTQEQLDYVVEAVKSCIT
jgi:dTDP-4-amino-4,6-dideoxygalactose transaminase